MKKVRPVRWLERLDQTARNASPRTLFWSIVLIDLLLVAIVVFSTILPRSARISIEADTNIATVILPAQAQAFAWGKLPVDPSSIEDVAPACQNPSIDLRQPISGPLTMLARLYPEDERFIVTLKRPDDKSLGTLQCAGGSPAPSGPFVQIVWPKTSNRSVTLRFVGNVRVGEVSTEGDPNDRLLMTEGTITTEAASLPFHTGSVRSETRLYLADRASLYVDFNQKREAIAHGVIQVGQQGTFKLVAHANATEARVIHEGQEDETASSVAPSFWAKLQAQSEWTILAVIGALLLNIVAALRSYRDEVAGN